MTVKHLSVFLEVCKSESITLAAQKLNVTQPAVSIVIRELEDYYQTRLFERMNRRIYITDAGRALCNYAQIILEQLEEAKNVLNESNPIAPIRIGANITFSLSYLDAILEDVVSAYPQIVWHTVVDSSMVIEKAILNHELDFAIVDNISSSSLVESTLILQTKMIAVCSPEYVLSGAEPFQLEDLQKERFLLREPGSGSRDIVEQVFASRGMFITPAISSASIQFLLNCALRKLGIAILPEITVTPYIDAGQLCEIAITDVSFPRNYYLIIHKNKFKTKSLQLLLEFFMRYNGFIL